MGRKSRVPGSGASKDPRKWGLPAAKFLGGWPSALKNARMISACRLLVAAVLREKTPRQTQAQVNQGFEPPASGRPNPFFRR
jgi:hypothetical protein